MAQSTNNVCWICGAVANSSEHRIKKSDLVRVYGRGPYSGPSAPVHVTSKRQENVRGPKAAGLKYKPSICAACNNRRSQSWDIAYDRFVSWVLENEADVLKRRLIDFGDVYGSGFPDEQCNLFKYFVKSFGCRLVDAGVVVPEDIVSLLPQKHFITALKISFAVNEDLLLMHKSDQRAWLAKGDLLQWNCKDSVPSIGYSWHESVSWLTVNYWYGIEPDGAYGCPWIANSKFLYLGSYRSLSAEQREKLGFLSDGCSQ